MVNCRSASTYESFVFKNACSCYIVLVVGAGYLIGGIRSALVVCGLTLFIALSPWWDRALVTTYMATFGVISILYYWIYSWNSYVFKINIQLILC